MPCLSSKYDPRIGPIINIGVAAPGNLSPHSAADVMTFPALIDTGASGTCVSSVVAQTVGLQPIGLQPMTSATHSVPVKVYLVDLLLPFGSTAFVVPSIQVMEFMQGAGGPFQMLLGRDLLCKGSFTMTFDGHFTFCL